MLQFFAPWLSIFFKEGRCIKMCHLSFGCGHSDTQMLLMDFQDTGCTSQYCSEVPVRTLQGFLNYLCLPAALKDRCACVRTCIMH